MRAIICGFALSILAGCGVDETKFIPDYADQYCQTALDCIDPGVLAFDGIGTMDDCLSVIGPAIEEEVGNCDYSPKSAKRCLKAMKGMGCPGDGQTIEDILPPDCAEVSANCKAQKDDPTTPTGTTTPTGGTGE